METKQLSRPKYPTKLVRIDATTWIETKVDVPDEVARQKFLLKLTPILKPSSDDLLSKTLKISTSV